MLDVSDRKQVFNRMNELRRERGWSIYKLAVEAGVSPNMMYNWRDRKSYPTLENLECICSALGITIVQFLYDGQEYSELIGQQREFLYQWYMLTGEQKASIAAIMKIFKDAR